MSSDSGKEPGPETNTNNNESDQQDDDEMRDSVSDMKNPSVQKRPIPEEVSGSLLRLKNKPSTFSSWDSRFLKVNPAREELEFYPAEKDQYHEPLQTLPLAHITRVQAVDQFSLQIIVKGKPETVIFLRAASPEEKMRWVHNLELFIRELRAYESWQLLSKMTSEARVEVPEHGGWLYKLRRTPTFGPSWNKRYFRLSPTDQTLDYFNSVPKKGSDPKDRRSIELASIVDVRTIDPWTFQIEVKEEMQGSAPGAEKDPRPEGQEGQEGQEPPLSPRSARRLAKQDSVQAGNMSYFCLQAKTRAEQTEWKSVLENCLMDLAVVKECEFLGDRR